MLRLKLKLFQPNLNSYIREKKRNEVFKDLGVCPKNKMNVILSFLISNYYKLELSSPIIMTLFGLKHTENGDEIYAVYDTSRAENDTPAMITKRKASPRKVQGTPFIMGVSGKYVFTDEGNYPYEYFDEIVEECGFDSRKIAETLKNDQKVEIADTNNPDARTYLRKPQSIPKTNDFLMGYFHEGKPITTGYYPQNEYQPDSKKNPMIGCGAYSQIIGEFERMKLGENRNENVIALEKLVNKAKTFERSEKPQERCDLYGFGVSILGVEGEFEEIVFESAIEEYDLLATYDLEQQYPINSIRF